MSQKQIILLIGPKGSGKSFIGEAIQDHFGIPFLRVEDWVKDLRQGRALDQDGYLKEVFGTIEAGVRLKLETTSPVVFESTGLTAYFDRMLSALKQDFQVYLIGVDAKEESCRERIKKRDVQIHIPLSDTELSAVNQQVRHKTHTFDYQIMNEGKSRTHILEELKTIEILKLNR